MSNYICKIAGFDEIVRKWDYEISLHPDDEKWVIWRNKSIESFNNNKQLCYIGIMDGEIISEATAMLSADEVQNGDGVGDSDGLVGESTAYLCAFRTRKEDRGKGFFSKLFQYMEEDLYKKGYRTLTLGVEPEEELNRKIYFKYGFMHFIKSAYEIYPDGEKILVEYYSKEL